MKIKISGYNSLLLHNEYFMDQYGSTKPVDHTAVFMYIQPLKTNNIAKTHDFTLFFS